LGAATLNKVHHPTDWATLLCAVDERDPVIVAAIVMPVAGYELTVFVYAVCVLAKRFTLRRIILLDGICHTVTPDAQRLNLAARAARPLE
jgi:hypothetical protein